MAWLKVCSIADAPQPGTVTEADAGGKAICLANLNGEFSALDSVCPHRGGPLGQGSVEGESVVCPWHAWTFNLKTGVAEMPVDARARVFQVKAVNGELLVEVALGESS